MLAILAAVACLVPPSAEWELLGTRRVSFTLDHDAIVVRARAGAFTAIKIEVAGGNLEMYNIRLTFGNGDTWSPNTRVQFQEGASSRTIDLPGSARVIRRIDFWYRSRVRRGAATVRVFGRGGEAPAEPAVAELRPALTVVPPPSTQGWEHLGARPVDFRVDHDAVLAGRQGAFRVVRFDVEGGNLEMFNIKITFGNGETFSPPTRLLFSAGTLSRVIDLPGEARIIRRIDFFYRSVGGPLATGALATQATVHVYGRR